MKKLQRTEATFVSATLLLASLSISDPIAAIFKIDPVLAQAASEVPASEAPRGNTVRIDGSSSTKVTNEIRQQQLERRAPGTGTTVIYNGTDAALQSVLKNEADLAAVGRPLTPEEKARGLTVVPEKRHKIAVIVGSGNSFASDLTFEQFAKIFRGEITDWSQVGGAPGPIQLIDRPETNDTRQAFQNYSVFKQAPFVAAASAAKVSEDSTEAVIQKLGTRGISYAIADQVTNVPGVRIVPMHKTLPSDPRYPFSQPISYVYKGSTPSPAVAAFLDNSASAPAAKPEAIAPASPQAAAPTSTPPVAQDKGFPWWLLFIPVLGGLLWWLLKGGRFAPAVVPVAAPKVVPPVPVAPVQAAPIPQAAPVVLDEQSPITLYEERLVAEKTRQKVADVEIGKRTEIDHAQVSIPVDRERVVIERVASPDAGTVLSGDAAFGAGEVRLETYEEIPDIRKETFVREEVSIRKEIEQETVSAEETLRREELDVSTEGHFNLDNVNHQPTNLSKQVLHQQD